MTPLKFFALLFVAFAFLSSKNIKPGDGLGVIAHRFGYVYLRSAPDSNAPIIDTLLVNYADERIILIEGELPGRNGFVFVIPVSNREIAKRGVYGFDSEGWIEEKYIVRRPIALWYSLSEYDTTMLKMLIEYYEQDDPGPLLATSYAMANMRMCIKLHDKEPKRAIQYGTVSLKTAPNKGAFIARGKAKFFAEDYIGCLDDMDEALNFDATNESIYLYASIVPAELQRANPQMIKCAAYYNLGDYQKGITWGDKSVKAYPEDGRGYYFRGICKIKAGLKIEGCRDLSKAGELGLDAYNEIKELCNK